MNYRSRLLEKPLSHPASRGKVRLLFGARQTGKSTLLRQIAGPGDCLYLNLQDRRERLELERDPSRLTRRLEARRTPGLKIFIDEIQKVPSLLDEVQYLYDENPGLYEFFLTGSSARRLKTTAANLLPGRAHLYRLAPLTLLERRENRAGNMFPITAPARSEDLFPAAELEALLLYGNLPGVALENEESRVRTLETYVEVYLEEEIRREALVRNLGAFQQFLELTALESGRIINLSAASQETGIPITTLRLFYQVLEDTFVGYRLPAFGERTRKRVLTTPKFLLFDMGVRNAAARLSFSRDIIKTQAGQLFEMWVGLELMHRCLLAGRSWRLSFWRTAHQAEVDYVLETPAETIPIEVKWTERPSAADARMTDHFLNTYSRQAKRGFVVCRCAAPEQLTDRVQAIPWQMI